MRTTTREDRRDHLRHRAKVPRFVRSGCRYSSIRPPGRSRPPGKPRRSGPNQPDSTGEPMVKRGRRTKGRPLSLRRGVNESSLELTGSVRGRSGAVSPSIGGRRTSQASLGGAAPLLRSDGPTLRHRCRCFRLCHDRRPQGSDAGVAWPAGIWPRSTGGRPYADDSLRSGAARFGRIDRSVEGQSIMTLGHGCVPLMRPPAPRPHRACQRFPGAGQPVSPGCCPHRHIRHDSSIST
jgi:hypothetical protein